jgi:hypothetical protein
MSLVDVTEGQPRQRGKSMQELKADLCPVCPRNNKEPGENGMQEEAEVGWKLQEAKGQGEQKLRDVT